MADDQLRQVEDKIHELEELPGDNDRARQSRMGRLAATTCFTPRRRIAGAASARRGCRAPCDHGDCRVCLCTRILSSNLLLEERVQANHGGCRNGGALGYTRFMDEDCVGPRRLRRMSQSLLACRLLDKRSCSESAGKAGDDGFGK
eukprot:jgi/Mesvir1/4630/Mv24041-RA.1